MPRVNRLAGARSREAIIDASLLPRLSPSRVRGIDGEGVAMTAQSQYDWRVQEVIDAARALRQDQQSERLQKALARLIEPPAKPEDQQLRG
jgi:hypothetical protein